MNNLLLRRRALMGMGGRNVSDNIAIKATEAPKFMSLLYNAGLCASPDYITITEAASVTQTQFNNLGKLNNGKLEDDDLRGFEYFTGVTSIGKSWFDTAKLKYINLPNSITSLAYGAMQYVEAYKGEQEIFYIPASVTSVATYCLFGVGIYGNYSYNTKVVFQSTTPPSNFDNNTCDSTMYVPDESLSAYQALASNRTIKPISELNI